MLGNSYRLIAAAILGTSVSAFGAGINMSTVPVAAVVQPAALVKFEVVPINISISAADIARGYIDVPVGSLLSIKSGQALPPVIIDFTMGDGVFTAVEVREREQAKLESIEGVRRTELGPEDTTTEELKKTPVSSGDVTLKRATKESAESAGAGETSSKDRNTAAFAYRFKLSSKAKPGDYQIPVILNITF